MEALAHLYPLNKDGYGLTVTENMDFMFSLAENYDIQLRNRDVMIRLLTQFCPSTQVVANRDLL